MIGQPQNETTTVYQNTANKSVASKQFLNAQMFVMFGVLKNRHFMIDLCLFFSS